MTGCQRGEEQGCEGVGVACLNRRFERRDDFVGCGGQLLTKVSESTRAHTEAPRFFDEMVHGIIVPIDQRDRT